MLTLHTASFAIDAALLTLIWIVQVVVYPGFRHIEEKIFVKWHKTYTQKMGYIAAPLMIAQIVLATILLVNKPTLYSLFYASGVLATWLTTFFISVPCHKRLETNGKVQKDIDRLVTSNWIRTGLWSGIFLINASKQSVL